MKQGNVNARIQVHLVLSIWHQDVDPKELPGHLTAFQNAVRSTTQHGEDLGLLISLDKGDVIFNR